MRPTTRRAPRFGRFILTGVLAGLAVAALLTRFAGADGRYSAGLVMLYLGLVCGLVGGLLAAAVAVVLDRPRPRKAAEHGDARAS